MDKKNNTGILLLFLAILLIGGGLYFYKALVPEKKDNDNEEILKEVRVENTKKLAEENIKTFLTEDYLKSLYTSKQYKELKETNIFINLNTGVGNSNPFENNNIVE